MAKFIPSIIAERFSSDLRCRFSFTLINSNFKGSNFLKLAFILSNLFPRQVIFETIIVCLGVLIFSNIEPNGLHTLHEKIKNRIMNFQLVIGLVCPVQKYLFWYLFFWLSTNWRDTRPDHYKKL